MENNTYDYLPYYSINKGVTGAKFVDELIRLDKKELQVKGKIEKRIFQKGDIVFLKSKNIYAKYNCTFYLGLYRIAMNREPVIVTNVIYSTDNKVLTYTIKDHHGEEYHGLYPTEFLVDAIHPHREEILVINKFVE